MVEKMEEKMTESEYVTAANLARLRAIYALMQQLVIGYGVTEEDTRELFNKTEDMINRTYKEVALEVAA